MNYLFRFLSNLIPAAVIVLPIMFYYLYRRNILNTKREILLKEIEKGNIVDPEMLAKSLTNPITEERRLQNSLRCGIIFSFAGVVVTIACVVFYSYAEAQARGDNWGADELLTLRFVVTLVMVVGAILLGVGIAYLISYFNQKKRINKTA